MQLKLPAGRIFVFVSARPAKANAQHVADAGAAQRALAWTAARYLAVTEMADVVV